MSNEITIKLTSHDLDVLKTIVEFAALHSSIGADADPTTEILLQHLTGSELSPETCSANVSDFVAKARRALS